MIGPRAGRSGFTTRIISPAKAELEAFVKHPDHPRLAASRQGGREGAAGGGETRSGVSQELPRGDRPVVGPPPSQPALDHGDGDCLGDRLLAPGNSQPLEGVKHAVDHDGTLRSRARVARRRPCPDHVRPGLEARDPDLPSLSAILHILFNTWATTLEGTLIETRRGTLRLAVIRAGLGDPLEPRPAITTWIKPSRIDSTASAVFPGSATPCSATSG